MSESRNEPRTMQSFFAAAASRASRVEVWVDHPVQDFCLQTGICIEGNVDYLVIGPPNAPGRICLPYSSVRWFRALDEQ